MNCAICFEEINNKLICRNCFKCYCKQCFTEIISKHPSALTLINDIIHIQCPACSVDFNETDIVKSFGNDFAKNIIKHATEFRLKYLKQKWYSKVLDMLESTEDGITQLKRMKKLRKIIDLFNQEGLNIKKLGEKYNEKASDQIINVFKNYIKFWFEYEFTCGISGNESIIGDILIEDYDFTILDKCNTFGEIAKETLNEVCYQLHFSLENEFADINYNNSNDLKDINSFICPKCNVNVLTSDFRCEQCKIGICKKCYCIKTDDHICKSDDIESFKLIKDSTKSCPKCLARIYKISGCSQMFCTNCHTGFEWNTGKIITQNFHNPHRTEWLDKLEKQNIIIDDTTVVCDYQIQKLNKINLFKHLIEYRNHCHDYLIELEKKLNRNKPSKYELGGLTLMTMFNGFNCYCDWGYNFEDYVKLRTEKDLKIQIEYRIYETVLNIINPTLIMCDQMLINNKSHDDLQNIYNNVMEIYTQFIDTEVLPILKIYEIAFDFIKPKYIYQTYYVTDDYFNVYEYDPNNKPQMYFISYGLYKEMLDYLNKNKNRTPVKSFLDDPNFGNINKEIPSDFYYVLHEDFSSDNLMIHEIANGDINNLLIILEKYHSILTKEELIGLLVNVNPDFDKGLTREETWAWLEVWIHEDLRGEIYDKTCELFLPYDKNGNTKKYINLIIDSSDQKINEFINEYRNKHTIVSKNNYKHYWHGYGTEIYYELMCAAVKYI